MFTSTVPIQIHLFLSHLQPFKAIKPVLSVLFFAVLVTLTAPISFHIYLFCGQMFYDKLGKFQDSAISMLETTQSPWKSS